MLSFLLVTGPPFDVPLWTTVASRIEQKKHSVSTVSMLSCGDGSLDSEANQLAEKIFETTLPVVVIAHGTAIPAALNACQKVRPSAIVLSNGPLQSIDPLTKALIGWSKLPGLLTDTLISTDAILKVLASSIGLRRLVVNPYVMDHDTTVSVCRPIFASKTRRTRQREYFRSLSTHPWQAPPTDTPTMVLWGDSDILTRGQCVTFSNMETNGIDFQSIPGGRYLHPIERPWELADRCIEWAQKITIAT